MKRKKDKKEREKRGYLKEKRIKKKGGKGTFTREKDKKVNKKSQTCRCSLAFYGY
ncbi:hypothetical protein [Prevotella histicola]|uniref:hypothetical protein n=1 Tax=Prevotella histicola TaxID=470565 RepID=UPI0028EC2EE8|nr:hypothetical protein [Prevotella histicola]